MRSKFLLLAVIVCIQITYAGNIKISEEKKNEYYFFTDKDVSQVQVQDSLLFDIQNRIQKAFVNSEINQKPDELNNIERQLEILIDQNKNSIITYWLSYAYYYQSIYEIIILNKDESQKMVEKGIALLENLNKKQSEHYALLALMQSFSIQFSSGMSAAFISRKVKENADKAIELDSLNLRAYYALAINDFYTPEQYGGGQMTESLLKKAISLDDQSLINPYLPSWGKNQAYELLIRHYIKVKDYESAKKYYNEGIGNFPGDYLINQAGKDLISK